MASGILDKNTTAYEGDFTINKQSGTNLTLNTAEAFIDKNIILTLNVQAGSATTPATTITATPSISVNSSGLITATNSKTQNVTPTINSGFVSTGTAGTITVNGSNTKQLTTKSAETYTPTTTNQTIASGQYLTGAQTIKGDANLVASNIASGITIFGVTGSFQGGTNVSDTTATASDVLSGKYFYTAAGVKTQGTIATKTSTDVTLTGLTLNVPVGYYGTAVQKTVSSVTLTAPSSGTTTFSITVPNGASDPVTFTFTVDSNGNTAVNGTPDSITWATGGTF